MDVGANLGTGAFEPQVFLRQPFEACADGDEQFLAETRDQTRAAIETCGRRRGEQDLCAGQRMHGERQLIAADDAGRRMQEIGVTHIGGFGMEGPLHQQRSAVVLGDETGTATTRRELEAELSTPRQGSARGRGQGHGLRHVQGAPNSHSPSIPLPLASAATVRSKPAALARSAKL